MTIFFGKCTGVIDPEFGPDVWCCKQRNSLPQRPVLEAIKKKGIWDMESMNLRENGYDKAMSQYFAEKQAKEQTEENS